MCLARNNKCHFIELRHWLCECVCGALYNVVIHYHYTVAHYSCAIYRIIVTTTTAKEARGQAKCATFPHTPALVWKYSLMQLFSYARLVPAVADTRKWNVCRRFPNDLPASRSAQTARCPSFAVPASLEANVLSSVCDRFSHILISDKRQADTELLKALHSVCLRPRGAHQHWLSRPKLIPQRLGCGPCWLGVLAA